MIQLAYLFWDPKPEIFLLPILHYPILWYGVLFALGFILGFPLFVSILHRYFLLQPDFKEQDLKGTCAQPRLRGNQTRSAQVQAMNEWLHSTEPIEGAQEPTQSRRLQLENILPDFIIPLKKQAVNLADRVTVYMVFATVLGARLGHLLFYESPSYYLHNPMEMIAVWKGGLSSHGAALAIVLILGFFSYRFRVELRGLTWLGLLDFISVPVALAGASIRVGNFFNQEILGVKTTVPWAIIFGHPADHSLPAPRHPVQLYEALFYALAFFILWRLSYQARYLQERGRLGGLFLILVFGFRLFVEHWKLEQSMLMPFGVGVTMGQILSIPAVLIGLYLFFRPQKIFPSSPL